MKRIGVLGTLLLVVALSAGCASAPSPDAMKAEVASFQLPKLPEPGKAICYVVRPSGAGALIKFNVFVDDQQSSSEVGYTKGSEYIYFNLTPGPHRIYSNAENWADISITVRAGDVVYIQQEVAMGIIMARNSLSILDEVAGKYRVKTLQLGTILKAER